MFPAIGQLEEGSSGRKCIRSLWTAASREASRPKRRRPDSVEQQRRKRGRMPTAKVGTKRCSPFVGPALVDLARAHENGFSAGSAARAQQRQASSAAASSVAAASVAVAGLATAEYVQGSWDALLRSLLATDFAPGCAAGVSSIAATYPIGKLVTRQQVDGHSALQAARHMWLEGPWALYRGAQPLLLQRGMQLGIMFGTYGKLNEEISCSSLTRTLQPPEGTIRFVAGVLAGSTDALALTPLERVQTLMQLRQNKRCSLAGDGSMRNIATSLAAHGPRELYRGVGTALLRNGLCTGCYFMLLPHARASYGAARSHATERRWQLMLPVLQSARCEDFICGVGLGCGMSVFVFPMSTIMKRQQMRTRGIHISMREALSSIAAREGGGCLAVYRGLPAFMVKSAAAWGVTNLVISSIGTYR